jgi:hypothetical protein
MLIHFVAEIEIRHTDYSDKFRKLNFPDNKESNFFEIWMQTRQEDHEVYCSLILSACKIVYEKMFSKIV